MLRNKYRKNYFVKNTLVLLYGKLLSFLVDQAPQILTLFVLSETNIYTLKPSVLYCLYSPRDDLPGVGDHLFS
jgi:hypothetical protein